MNATQTALANWARWSQRESERFPVEWRTLAGSVEGRFYQPFRNGYASAEEKHEEYLREVEPDEDAALKLEHILTRFAPSYRIVLQVEYLDLPEWLREDQFRTREQWQAARARTLALKLGFPVTVAMYEEMLDTALVVLKSKLIGCTYQPCTADKGRL